MLPGSACSRYDVTDGADQSIKGCIALLMCGFSYDAAHENVSVYLKFFFFNFRSNLSCADVEPMDGIERIDYDGLLHDAYKQYRIIY